MEFKFLLAVLLFQEFSFTRITAEPLDHELLASRFPFYLELEQIASKISLLEVEMEERTIQLRNKDEAIGRMEEIIREKSDYITSLRSEIEFLQQKRSFDIKEGTAEEHIAKKMQVEMDGKEIGLEELTTDTLKSWAGQSDKKVHKLNLKLLSLQNVNNEQKIKIRKMELALQVMEEELTRTKLETVSISKDTAMVCEDRLPQLASNYFGHYQSLLANFLNEQGRPAIAATFQMAMKKKSQLKKWCESYIETIDAIWIPYLKEQWLPFTTYLEPHVPNVVLKGVEVYNAVAYSIITNVKIWIPYLKEQWLPFTTYLEPHVPNVVLKGVEVYNAAAYSIITNVKEVKKCIQPLIKLVVEVTKHHLENTQDSLMQYNGTLFCARQNFIRSVHLFHSQVQELLKSNNFIKPFVTMDLAWFAATALLALPLIFIFKLCSAISGKKSKKFNGLNHGRRGAKRSHPS